MQTKTAPFFNAGFSGSPGRSCCPRVAWVRSVLKGLARLNKRLHLPWPPQFRHTHAHTTPSQASSRGPCRDSNDPKQLPTQYSVHTRDLGSVTRLCYARKPHDQAFSKSSYGPTSLSAPAALIYHAGWSVGRGPDVPLSRPRPDRRLRTLGLLSVLTVCRPQSNRTDQRQPCGAHCFVMHGVPYIPKPLSAGRTGLSHPYTPMSRRRSLPSYPCRCKQEATLQVR